MGSLGSLGSGSLTLEPFAFESLAFESLALRSLAQDLELGIFGWRSQVRDLRLGEPGSSVDGGTQPGDERGNPAGQTAVHAF